MLLSLVSLALFLAGAARAQTSGADRVKALQNQMSDTPVAQPPTDAAVPKAAADASQIERIRVLEDRINKLESRVQKIEGGGGVTTLAKPNAAPGGPISAPRGGASGNPVKNRRERDADQLKAITEQCLAGCTVGSMKELEPILGAALPGSIITIAPGVYRVPGNGLKLEGAENAAAAKPITLRAERLGSVFLESNSLIAIRVLKPNWIVENLDVKGICQKHIQCEHAIQLSGPVSNTIIRNNRFREFNSALKSGGGPDRTFANDVIIEGNHIFNSSMRETASPVTQLDINGGQRWKIIDNFIADFAKARDNQISYAAFLKANSRDGLFERNLVICEWRHKGGTRVGLSFGGGGTSKAETCENRDCSVFHTNGTMRNNIVMNCPDVGIFLNKSKDARLYNNTLVATAGLDGMFAETSALIENNFVAGKIRARRDALFTEDNNISDSLLSAAKLEFTDPSHGDLSVKSGGALLMEGELPPGVETDFCGNPRTPSSAKIGAIAYGSGKCDVASRISQALEGLKE